MSRNRTRSLFCIALALASLMSGCSAAARSQTQTPASWKLALHFRSGEHLIERSYENDRIDWKLPKRRLDRFRAEGVIINEESHVTTTIQATVVSVVLGTAFLRGTATVSSLDVPRHQTLSSQDPFVAALASNNLAVTAQTLEVEDAAMAAFPSKPVALGQHWQTHFEVTTTLGSGSVTYDHRVAAFQNGLLEIAVTGAGSITGAEYHLPMLLPGTISLAGTAWFDPSSRLIVQESYAIRNRIIKPMQGEESGFDERLNVDTSTHKLQ